MFQAQDQPKCGKEYVFLFVKKNGIAELKYVSRENGAEDPHYVL